MSNTIVLDNGKFRAEIVPEIGGNIISLRHCASGTKLLREPSDLRELAEFPARFGMPVLFPPNRIRDGRFAFEGKDKAESETWYKKAAEALYKAAKQGDPRAQHDLAGLYRDGIGVAKDPAEADKWFALAVKNYRAAAEQGDPEAQCMLGGFFMKGVGVEKDEAEAVRWFRRAVEQGCMKGKALLGLACFEGKGVKKDEAEGVRWLQEAAEQGDPDARAFLESHGQ